MPRFDFYVAFSFDGYDEAARFVRALQAEGKRCFTDSYICDEVLSAEETQAALDYCDGAIIVTDGKDGGGLTEVARLAAGIGLFVSLVKTEDFPVPEDVAAYEGLRVYIREETDWEKTVADRIVVDNPVDEDTAQLLKMMSVFEQDNGKFEMEFSLKKLARLREAVKKNPELASVYIKGVFESANLDWNNASKEELTEWWNALSFAKERAGSGSIADIRLLDSMMYRVRKALFP